MHTPPPAERPAPSIEPFIVIATDMCGVCGCLGTTADASLDGFMDGAIVAHERRGPDYHATAIREIGHWRCGLGHNRLSILDLSSAAHQPMRDESRGTLVSFNGEIYNYVELRDTLRAAGHAFVTTSDTEVLLAAYRQWGIDCVERFDGMFAFALLDLERRRLFLVRDRFGVKPLYYRFSGKQLLFSSTARPIARIVGMEPSLPFVLRGLTSRGYEHDSEETQYANVSSVRPGHVYEIDLGAAELRLTRRRFYDFSARVEALRPTLTALSAGDATDRVRAEIERAVRLRLRADVPVGVSLSGGLDSSTVAAAAAAQHSNVVGFCFGHPDAADTEGPVVERLRRQLGMRVEYVWPSPAEMRDGFWECLAAQDAPFTTLSVVAQYEVYRQARAAGIRVLLGGQGGDETFMGYRKYQAFHFRRLMHLRQFGRAAGQAVDIGRIAWSERRSVNTYLAAARRYMGPRMAQKTIFERSAAAALPLGHASTDDLWHRQVVDLFSTSLPTLLRYEDRNSMGNSIESRLPFVDHHLVELGVALPESLKLREGLGKWVVRQAVAGKIPREITHAIYKRGFDVGSRAWFQAGLGSTIRETLHDTVPRLRHVLAESVDVDRYFSDERLAQPSVFTEAATAAWLGQTST